MRPKKKKLLDWLVLIVVCAGVDWYLLHRIAERIPEGSFGKLFIMLLALEILGIYYLLKDTAHYKADMVQITPDIATPAPMGQGQYGSARWLRKDEFDKVFDTVVISPDTTQIDYAGLVIGKEELRHNREKVYYIKDTVHSITIGATRSGKTRHEVLETIGLNGLAGNSMIITDIKGELYDFTAPFLREQDYETVVIDFDEKELSARINILQPVIDLIDTNQISEAIDATWDIVSQMVGEAKGEKIWNNGECATIAGSIMAVCYDNRHPENHKYRNLTNAYYFLTEMCTPVKGVMPLQLYVMNLPNNHPAKGMFAVADVAPPETRGGFYTSAILTLRLFTNPLIYNMTKQSDFAFEEIGIRRMALYIILPEDKLTYHSIATLIVTQIYSSLSKYAKNQGGELPQIVDYICDEFGNFAKIPSFAQMLTVAGGKRIRFNLFLQDYAQLEKVYEKEDARTIRNNCNITVYLRSADVDTRESISKDLDEYTTKGYSVNYGKDTREGTSSVNLVGRRLLTAEEVGRIKRPYSLIMSDNHPAIMYAPDLSKWSFNDRFGMGSRRHNQKLRMQRREERSQTVREQEPVQLWGIWQKWKQQILSAAKKKEEKQKESSEREEG